MTTRQIAIAIVLMIGSGALAETSSLASVITIPLDKQYVPVMRNEKIVSYKTAYFGRIHLGFPRAQRQTFTVVFDTGSGHLFLPSLSCASETCRGHRRFSTEASPSAEPIDHIGQVVSLDSTERDQVEVAFGTGDVSGDFVRETVCLSVGDTPDAPKGSDCTDVRVILATQMSKEPFSTFEFDGVLGLGLAALAVDPEFSFFGQMTKQNNLSQASFGYFLSRSDTVPSEISFGGHDVRRMATELQWSPVHKPELGYWQMRLLSVRIGDEKLPICEDGDCVAIADTGTSLLGAPRQATQKMHLLLARKVPNDPAEIDCREFPGPDLIFELAGGVTIILGPEDYSRATGMRVLNSKTNHSQVVCRASLLPVEHNEVLGPKAFILGEPALRKYYTAYDWQKQRVGFALSAQPAADEALPAAQHAIIGAPPAETPVPTTIMV